MSKDNILSFSPKPKEEKSALVNSKSYELGRSHAISYIDSLADRKNDDQERKNCGVFLSGVVLGIVNDAAPDTQAICGFFDAIGNALIDNNANCG